MKGSMDTDELMKIIRTRRSVSVYKGGKIVGTQMEAILEAARWVPSGANTQPWELVVKTQGGFGNSVQPK
jgi:nitroreductase